MRKRCFTLLEMIMCVAILALVAGALSFSLSGMLARHRFHQGVKQFMIHAREMQSLALNHQSDMGLMLYYDKDKLWCRGFTDEPIAVFRPFELQNVRDLTFDRKKAKMPLKLTFFASGRIYPGGILCFSSKTNSLEIDLRHAPQITMKEKLHASD